MNNRKCLFVDCDKIWNLLRSNSKDVEEKPCSTQLIAGPSLLNSDRAMDSDETTPDAFKEQENVAFNSANIRRLPIFIGMESPKIRSMLCFFQTISPRISKKT